MYLYKLAVLLILNIVFVQAWYTTVVENGTTIVRTKSRSRSSTAASSSTTTSSPTTNSSSNTTTSAAVSSPTNTLHHYYTSDCSGNFFYSSSNDGCFDYENTVPNFSLDMVSTSSSTVEVNFYHEASCAGPSDHRWFLSSNTCLGYPVDHEEFLSYSVITVS